eukprot:CAMPEP_0184971684 /NCGR_PEP_ID=MMETSP1098-20130426/3887_1 /TAXON_ID=89044 /ORGANISM="Spumella elongata, Strain CCAP 955/1" /LENGTH=496 /DNA_ID=CAMNT_0027493861 /DNA_START=112 /DNA_END=1599 /DNA_ORIENTATION=-
MSTLNRKYSDRMEALSQAENGNDQSPGEVKTPSRIKRPVSMYEKNLSTKSTSSNGQSPQNNEISTMRHALKRYQSHLSELKEIKATPPPPPVEVPVQVFERPETPEPASLSVDSIETVEFPEPTPVEPFPINHVPGYLSDPASTLLMTAALNALTQAQAQVKVKPQNGQSTRDPMAAALAAASAQIIAATLIRPAPPPPVESPPTPPRAPTPPPPPPVIKMNSVSTETDIERPPSPVMAKELHDRMRRSGMTQVYDPHGYPGGMPGSYSNSSSSYDRGSYNGYSSSHSGGYPQSPYGHNYHPQHLPHQQFHQDRHQQGLRPALPTSNSFELPPSRTFSSSSANGLRNNQPLSKSAKQSPVPVPLKKPQPMLPPPSPQPPQTTMRAPSPPLPPSPPVSSLSLPVNAGRSTSVEGVTGIASASAGSPLPSGRDTEVKKEELSKPPDVNEKTEVPAPALVPAPVSARESAPAPAPAVAALPVKESTPSGINNCSSNSFA